jgi:beta-glucosidase
MKPFSSAAAWAMTSLMMISSSNLAQASSFPQGFKWCVATSAHQIEGHNLHSDWWEFEQRPGSIRDGKPSGVAADHWNRLEQDVELLAALNVQQYRFSIEWAKIEPRPGEWNLEALEHYRHELELLSERGIEPIVTLQHFTLPKWVADRGGFEWSGMPDAFMRYSEIVFSQIGSSVRDWITINEPQVVLAAGYIEGVHPPLKKDLKHVDRPAIGMVRSHALAYHRLHELARNRGQEIRIGMAHHLRVYEPASKWNPLDRFAARLLDDLGNWSMVDALETGVLRIRIPFTLNVQHEIPEARGTQDFVGVNYYSRDLIQLNLAAPGFLKRLVRKNAARNDLGWEIHPEGLYKILRAVNRRMPNRPILITENGTADHRDAFRSKFIVDHLAWLSRAINEGIPVENYCHWSFLDNYEWSEGFEPRFGLYEVNYSTQERTIRESGRVFSEIARTSRLPKANP